MPLLNYYIGTRQMEDKRAKTESLWQVAQRLKKQHGRSVRVSGIASARFVDDAKQFVFIPLSSTIFLVASVLILVVPTIIAAGAPIWLVGSYNSGSRMHYACTRVKLEHPHPLYSRTPHQWSEAFDTPLSPTYEQLTMLPESALSVPEESITPNALPFSNLEVLYPEALASIKIVQESGNPLSSSQVRYDLSQIGDLANSDLLSEEIRRRIATYPIWLVHHKIEFDSWQRRIHEDEETCARGAAGWDQWLAHTVNGTRRNALSGDPLTLQSLGAPARVNPNIWRGLFRNIRTGATAAKATAAALASAAMGLLIFWITLTRAAWVRAKVYMKSIRRMNSKSRKFALFLRSFSSDEDDSDTKHIAELETTFVKWFAPIGATVAIDNVHRPGRTNGAIRIACTNDTWREAVSHLSQSAAVVLIDASQATEHVVEEIRSTVFANQRKAPFIVLAFVGNFYDRRHAWTRIKSRLGEKWKFFEKITDDNSFPGVVVLRANSKAISEFGLGASAQVNASRLFTHGSMVRLASRLRNEH